MDTRRRLRSELLPFRCCCCLCSIFTCLSWHHIFVLYVSVCLSSSPPLSQIAYLHRLPGMLDQITSIVISHQSYYSRAHSHSHIYMCSYSSMLNSPQPRTQTQAKLKYKVPRRRGRRGMRQAAAAQGGGHEQQQEQQAAIRPPASHSPESCHDRGIEAKPH